MSSQDFICAQLNKNKPRTARNICFHGTWCAHAGSMCLCIYILLGLQCCRNFSTWHVLAIFLACWGLLHALKPSKGGCKTVGEGEQPQREAKIPRAGRGKPRAGRKIHLRKGKYQIGREKYHGKGKYQNGKWKYPTPYIRLAVLPSIHLLAYRLWIEGSGPVEQGHHRPCTLQACGMWWVCSVCSFQCHKVEFLQIAIFQTHLVQEWIKPAEVSPQIWKHFD